MDNRPQHPKPKPSVRLERAAECLFDGNGAWAPWQNPNDATSRYWVREIPMRAADMPLEKADDMIKLLSRLSVQGCEMIVASDAAHEHYLLSVLVPEREFTKVATQIYALQREQAANATLDKGC